MGTSPTWSTGNRSVVYCPGGSRAGSMPRSTRAFRLRSKNPTAGQRRSVRPTSVTGRGEALRRAPRRRGTPGRTGPARRGRAAVASAGGARPRASATQLADAGITRLLASPFVRCVQTLVPLGDELGVPVEADAAPGRGPGRPRGPRPLAKELRDTSAVLCSHGDVIPDLLEALRRAAAPSSRTSCAGRRRRRGCSPGTATTWPRAATSRRPPDAGVRGRSSSWWLPARSGVDLLAEAGGELEHGGRRVEGVEPVELVGRPAGRARSGRTPRRGTRAASGYSRSAVAASISEVRPSSGSPRSWYSAQPSVGEGLGVGGLVGEHLVVEVDGAPAGRPR